MYFRKKTSGGRAYLQIVESRREGAQVRQQVIATLGRVEDLRESGQLERLLRSGARFATKAIVVDALNDGAAIAADVRRIGALWRDCRRQFGASGPFLFGGFSAADAMYAPVASRFRTYLPDLAPWGDDGTAQAYVDALFALPAMAEWEEGARREAKDKG